MRRFGSWSFFFQAEDGIRDHCVTGVQTCALPILRVNSILPSIIDTEANRKAMPDADFAKWPKPEDIARIILRSEERRVGKERRSLWAGDEERRKRAIAETTRHCRCDTRRRSAADA